MCRMYLALVGIWDTLIGIPLSIFVAYRELKTSGPHPVWRQTARQHLLHFITTHIYIYIYIYMAPAGQQIFFLSAFKRSPTRMDFRMCVGPNFICPMRLPGTTAGWTRSISPHTHTHTHIHSSYHDYNRSVLHTTCMKF